jgi:hypothetical protein
VITASNVGGVAIGTALMTVGLLIPFFSLLASPNEKSWHRRVAAAPYNNRSILSRPNPQLLALTKRLGHRIRSSALAQTTWATALNPGFRRRRESARLGFPDLLDLLALSVAAGISFDAAIARAAQSLSGSLRDELSIVMSDISIGVTRAESLIALAHRLKLNEVLAVAAAIGHADALGTPIADALREQARASRETRLRQLEERTQKLPVKLLMPLVLCILPALFVVIIGPAVLQIINSGLLG